MWNLEKMKVALELGDEEDLGIRRQNAKFIFSILSREKLSAYKCDSNQDQNNFFHDKLKIDKDLSFS